MPLWEQTHKPESALMMPSHQLVVSDLVRGASSAACFNSDMNRLGRRQDGGLEVGKILLMICCDQEEGQLLISLIF